MCRSKKFMAIALVATMVFGSSLTAFADEPTTTGGSDGAGTSEGHVEKEVLNVVLPVIPTGSTPFAYTMDPERLIRETAGAKYAEGTTFPEAEGDTGVYFQTGENTYANASNVVQAINKSSCDVTLTVKVKTTATGDTDIALATSSTVATTGTPNLYLGLKVGTGTTVVSGTEQTVTKTIAGDPDNFEIAVTTGENDAKSYVYQQKADATTWKAVNISMEGAVSNLPIAATTTAPTVNVTWSYAKAADSATVDTADLVDYSDTPASAAPSLTGSNSITINSSNAGKALTIGLSLGSGAEAATAVTKVDCNGGTITTDKYELTSSGLELKAAFVDAMLGSSNTADRVFTVFLNDTAKTELKFTIKR
jgi:hypothetical protein